MADLTDLKAFGEQLLPLMRELFSKAENNDETANIKEALAVLDRLKKLVAESAAETNAGLGLRVQAISAVHTALTEVLILAAQHKVSLPPSRVETIEAQKNALRDAYGCLLVRAACDPIAQLLSSKELDEIGQQLDSARREVRSRQRARQVLDGVLKGAVIAAKVAVKVA